MKKLFCKLDFAKIAALAKAANDKEAHDLAWDEYFKVMCITLRKRDKIDDEHLPILKPYIDKLGDYDWDEWEKEFASRGLEDLNKHLEKPMSVSDRLKFYK